MFRAFKQMMTLSGPSGMIGGLGWWAGKFATGGDHSGFLPSGCPAHGSNERFAGYRS